MCPLTEMMASFARSASFTDTKNGTTMPSYLSCASSLCSVCLSNVVPLDHLGVLAWRLGLQMRVAAVKELRHLI